VLRRDASGNDVHQAVAKLRAQGTARIAISPAEVSAMDPQRRLLLEGGYAALHASGADRAALSGNGTGTSVALGIYATEFAQPLAHSPLGCSVYANANSLSIARGRESFALGLPEARTPLSNAPIFVSATTAQRVERLDAAHW